MRKALLPLVGVALLLGHNSPSAQSKASPLLGVWQTVEIVVAGANPRTFTIPEPRPYLTIITVKHYSRTEVQAEAPRQVLADPSKATADELRAVWGPFVSEAGTYEVQGDVITMHPIAS